MTNRKNYKGPAISAEARAKKLFDVFIFEHYVPVCLHDDLLDEIVLALECYSDDITETSVQQSELYEYMEDYLVRWVNDLKDSKLPSPSDIFNWGFWPTGCREDFELYDDPYEVIRITIYQQ